MDTLETHDVRGLTVKIFPDDNPESPREWDNLGTMVCWHRRYNLGDGKHPFDSPQAFLESLLPESVKDSLDRRFGRDTANLSINDSAGWEAAEKAHRDRVMEKAHRQAVILPLYLYDHSGITMSTAPFSCPWDSGQVGYIYVSREKVLKEYNATSLTPAIRAKAEASLRSEVSTYDDYLTGSVYGYVVEDEEGDTLDSCWGFYGLDYCREEAMGAAKWNADKRDAQVELEAIEHD